MNHDVLHASNKRLAPREIEVLTLTAQGKNRGEIAEILSIAETTVKEYVEAACQKLNATNKTQASVIAIFLGLISPYRPHGLIQNQVCRKKKVKKPLQTEDAGTSQVSLSRGLKTVEA